MFETFQDVLKSIFPSLFGESEILTDDLLEVLYEDDGSHYQTKRIDGVVTKVRESQGLAVIDHEIYMDLSIPIVGGKKIRLGDHLILNVKRRSEKDAWIVDRVEMIDRKQLISNDSTPENDFSEYLKSKIVIGKVTSITSCVSVNNGQVFFNSREADGITLCVGDWVSMNVFYDPEEVDEKLNCTKVTPLRQWKLEGRITVLNGKDGVIDDTIFLHTSVCINGYLPKLKDWVHVNAIESDAGGPEFKWRAVSVVPNSRNLNSFQLPVGVTKIDQDYLQDTSEITVERKSNFGTLMIGSNKNLPIEIENISSEDQVLISAKFVNHRGNFELRDQIYPVIIPSKRKITIEVFFNASTMGKVNDILELDFGKYLIGRMLSVDVHGNETRADNSNGDFLARFKQRQQISRRSIMEDASFRDTNWVLKGVRPYVPPPFTSSHLGQYPVPYRLWQSLTLKEDLVSFNSTLGEALSLKNYREKFKILLHLEEIEMTVRLRTFDINRASLNPIGSYLALEVVGLAEKRPSLVPGDTVLLSSPWSKSGIQYEGFVHQTLKSEVFLKFHPNFHLEYSGEDYNVRFQFNRTPLRRFHAAVESSVTHPGIRVLFPSDLELRPSQLKLPVGELKRPVADLQFVMDELATTIEWVNTSLNQEQRRAILRILEGSYRPIPYIIYGPPGTGKTMTVVEAVLQLFFNCPHSRILIATPSNSSADLIAYRLHSSGKISPGDMIRLNAFSRNIDAMPESIQSYGISCDDMEQAIRHRILVTTCTTAGKIYTVEGLQHGHFTHLFIDEAGQATEPESLVPIGLLRCDSNPGQIILAGDPQQLGPVLMSNYASAYGLSQSLLERLTLHPLYQRSPEFAEFGHYNPKLLTKLVRNYRSHPALLALPSKMFYDNELIPCVSHQMLGRIGEMPWLVKPGVPLLFHGVRGDNYQEPDSPSWCNPAEVYHVVRYLQLLLNQNINPEDVGVITPYRKQVEKIRKFMKSNDLCPFKVGTVEEFQGQERDVIIVSTVRSQASYVDVDVSYNMGFLRSPKRFNVTITRAKALLIVIGNPHLLIHDEHWGQLLKQCIQLGSYTGCDLPLSIPSS